MLRMLKIWKAFVPKRSLRRFCFSYKFLKWFSIFLKSQFKPHSHTELPFWIQNGCKNNSPNCASSTLPNWSMINIEGFKKEHPTSAFKSYRCDHPKAFVQHFQSTIVHLSVRPLHSAASTPLEINLIWRQGLELSKLVVFKRAKLQHTV